MTYINLTCQRPLLTFQSQLQCPGFNTVYFRIKKNVVSETCCQVLLHIILNHCVHIVCNSIIVPVSFMFLLIWSCKSEQNAYAGLFWKKMRGKGWRVERREVQEFLTLVYHSLSSCFSFCGTVQIVAL